jgi:ketosteroid isomerase-like protein
MYNPLMVSVLGCVAALWTAPAWAGSEADTARSLLTLERQAMDGWLKGDPDPQLAISDPDITYIHDTVGRRLEGLAVLKEFYAQYRGVSLFDSYEILSPKIQESGDVAVLTYQLAQNRASTTRYWNATQVYAKKAEGWRVIHSHWSAARDRQP